MFKSPSAHYRRVRLLAAAVLIASETDIIYPNPATDPYTPGPNGDDLATMAQENHDTLTAVIGTANYDLGHVFHYGGNGLASAGYAFFGACTTEWKDIAGTIVWGVTPDHPVGLRTLLHEFGHQFTAYHSFNGMTAACQFSRNPEGAYEPGSGSSIMSYADLCGAENVPATSLFNAGALEQIIDYTTNRFGNSCAAPTATGNTPPNGRRRAGLHDSGKHSIHADGNGQRRRSRPGDLQLGAVRPR